MADLTVQPAYQFLPTDIVTVDKLNLLGTPVVSLNIETPVTDINFFRNGNFYSAFWTNATGLSCPVGVETINADYWSVNPNGAAVTTKRSTDTPDIYSLWSLEIDGAASVTDCSVGQQINGDLSATMRRPSTFSGYIENNSGLVLSPTLEIWTANSFNNFATTTLQKTVNLQTIANATWGYVTVTVDFSTVTNTANGLFIKIRLPSGTLSATTKRVNFSRLKIQLGEVATQFTDDPSQFIQTASVDSTMLQDGCLARPTLYVTNPGVIPKGAYSAGSIQSSDIGVGQVEAVNLDPGIATTTAANFTVPAVNATVPITLTSVTGISAGLVLNIAGAGNYSTVSIAGSVITATNLGSTGAASPGTIINSGASVTTTGNAVVGCLGYTPVNKGGDTGLGVISSSIDTVVHNSSYVEGGFNVQITSANAGNDGYFPAIGFNRPGVIGKAVGLSTSNRFKTIDSGGTVGYLLDTQTGVDTNSYQNGSITLAKLATSLVNIIIPPGMIRFFAGPSPPATWLVCDGSAVSRTTYAALYAAIGTYWGAGDNITTFNLPDFRGRSPLGYVNNAVAGITPRSFASLGGEEYHVLSQAELAAHSHSVLANTTGISITQTPHSHGIVNPVGGAAAAVGSGQYSAVGSTQTLTANANVSISDPGHAHGVSNTGGNGGHNNMSPFAVLYVIIKT